MVNDSLLVDAIKALFYPWIKEAVAEALREFKAESPERYPEKISVYQASEITGYSKNSLYQMHCRGQVPGAQKVRGKLVFDTATLREWVNNGGI